MNYIGDDTAVLRLASAYFAGIHLWLPMVSTRRLTASLQTGSMQFDTALLLLAMKLVTSRLEEGSTAVDHYLYAACKRYTNTLPETPFLSLSFLQATILVSLYEYGHGILPAAWFTIGQCIQYLDLLGLVLSKVDGDAGNRPVSGSPQILSMHQCLTVMIR